MTLFAPVEIFEEDTRDDEDSNEDHGHPPSHENDLTMLQAAALLTADCLGTGLLALPQDIQVLGWVAGLGFLVANLPINWYAGKLLSNAALEVERRHEEAPQDTRETKRASQTADGNYSTFTKAEANPHNAEHEEENDDYANDNNFYLQDENPTHDYVCIARAIFQSQPRITAAVFYTNIFLVLGDYILVQSHAVAAMLGEGSICLPTAGLLASTLMFGLSQLRTMSQLGHSVTAVSLLCLLIVVVQCLVAGEGKDPDLDLEPLDISILQKLSALASIGFATGSNKLILNIRNEMKDPREAPKTVGVALGVYGSVYIVICVFAGPNPPSFLFDSIPKGLSRKIAGLFLWIHVAVSFAINSQALCSSLDQNFFHHITLFNLHNHPARRWFVLTGLITVSSYLVANVVPFFKDLVALIGALTSVPLTLLLPVVLHRRLWEMPLCYPTRHNMASYALMIFSILYLVMGLTGSVSSIENDWTHHGRPFSCSLE